MSQQNPTREEMIRNINAMMPSAVHLWNLLIPGQLLELNIPKSKIVIPGQSTAQGKLIVFRPSIITAAEPNMSGIASPK